MLERKFMRMFLFLEVGFLMEKGHIMDCSRYSFAGLNPNAHCF